MKLPEDLPRRPAEEAIRRYALLQLERAAGAREQLLAGDRDEALHDFRVAIRRLRSLARVHRETLASDSPKKLLRRLRELTRDTNPGRDAEVQLAWLATIGEGLRPHERSGYRTLVSRLEERRDDCYRRVEREIVRDFSALAEQLRARLATYRVAVALDENGTTATFADATREALGRERLELEAHLAGIGGADDDAAAHAARIAAKRVRYLLEPLGPWFAAVRPAVDQLKELQDLLGELRDGQLLAAELGRALAALESRRAELTVEQLLAGGEAARAPRQRERAGFVAIARRLGARRGELYARFSAAFLAAEAAPLAALSSALDRVRAELAAPLRASPHADAPAPSP